MKVSDVLHVKGNAPFTVCPEQTLSEAVQTMAGNDTGSVVVMEHGERVGMLTLREGIGHLHGNRGVLGVTSFYDVARAVLEAQSFENQMLKAYIRDWSEQEPAN